MAQADHLRVVFEAGGTRFVMPVKQLLLVSEVSGKFDASDRTEGACQLGSVSYLEARVPVMDLAGLMALPQTAMSHESRCLIFSGADHPWAIVADRVVGIIRREQLDICELPDYFFRPGCRVYGTAALMDDEPLVCCDVDSLEAAWRAS